VNNSTFARSVLLSVLSSIISNLRVLVPCPNFEVKLPSKHLKEVSGQDFTATDNPECQNRMHISNLEYQRNGQYDCTRTGKVYTDTLDLMLMHILKDS